MNEKLREYVDSLFEGVAVNKRTVELKEEMLQNLNEKYNDLIADGKNEDAAFNIAVASVGDISDLLRELEKGAPTAADDRMEAARRRSAKLVSVAVMLYILCCVPVIVLSEIRLPGGEIIGIVAMFVMIAAATGLIIYNNMTKPRYVKRDDTVVEEFKEWQQQKSDKNSLRKSVESAMWAIVVALYFIISFATGAWYVTWVIFLIGGAVEGIIRALFDVQKR